MASYIILKDNTRIEIIVTGPFKQAVAKNTQGEIIFTGNKVADLVNSNLNAGIYKTVFEAIDLQGGVFIIKLTVNGKSITRKLVLIN